ncbi:MAG: zf-HC2 domain-containing protein [Candidatus Manganitrophaceae bacterium]
MDCREVKKVLPDLVDLTLPEREAGEVGRHLASCPRCAEEVKLIRKSWALLGVWEEIPPFAGFKERFWAKIDALEGASAEMPVTSGEWLRSYGDHSHSPSEVDTETMAIGRYRERRWRKWFPLGAAAAALLIALIRFFPSGIGPAPLLLEPDLIQEVSADSDAGEVLLSLVDASPDDFASTFTMLD